MNLPFIKEGIFEPHKSLVEREESSYIYIYREREREMGSSYTWCNFKELQFF